MVGNDPGDRPAEPAGNHGGRARTLEERMAELEQRLLHLEERLARLEEWEYAGEVPAE